MTDRYAEYEDTPTWKSLDDALRRLEKNRDIVLSTSREHVVGFLCWHLAQSRPQQAQAAIHDVLLASWDPIGIKDEPECQDEYMSYVAGVYRLLMANAPAREIAEHLATIERDSMGLSSDAARLLAVAERLKEVDVRSAP